MSDLDLGRPVQPVAVERVAGERKCCLEVEFPDAREFRLMSRQELLDSGVEPDHNGEAFLKYLETGECDDYWDEYGLMGECFDDGYYGLSPRNTTDCTAIRLSRGDAVLSLSAHKLMGESIGLLIPYDNCTTVVLARDVCVAAIVTNWVGGDAVSNLLIDFRNDTPLIQNVSSLDCESCIDAIAVSSTGEILIRDWWKRLGVLDSNLELREFDDTVSFEEARRAFASIPRHPEIAGWVFGWPFAENSWEELPILSIL